MIGILLTVLVAALVYLLLAALTGSAIVAIIGAILVLIAGIPSGGFGFGNRWGSGRRAGITAPVRTDDLRAPHCGARVVSGRVYAAEACPPSSIGRALHL